MDYTKVTISNGNITISSNTDIGGRGSSPSVGQSWVDDQLVKIHNACKGASNYVGVVYDLSPIDHYDEGYDHYEVAGGRMLKGDRKPRNESWEKTSTPKGWMQRIRIQYKETTRTTRPLTDAFKALGISTSYVKDVQKLLKKNGFCYISPKMYQTRYGYWEASRSEFEVGEENNYY